MRRKNRIVWYVAIGALAWFWIKNRQQAQAAAIAAPASTNMNPPSSYNF